MEENNARSISLKELWSIFVKCFWVMAIVAIVVTIGSYVVYKFTYKPLYESTATLYILDTNSTSSQSSAEMNDFNVADKVVKDCAYALCSQTVCEQVVDELGLESTYENLKLVIKTENPENTRFLNVSVTFNSPEEAKRIVDKICEVGLDKITGVMGFDQSNLFSEGTLEEDPCNAVSKLRFILFGFVGAVLVYAIYFVIFMLDDSIKTEEDIKNVLGLTILGDIPNANRMSESNLGKYSKYKGYRYYKHKNYGAYKHKSGRTNKEGK